MYTDADRGWTCEHPFHAASEDDLIAARIAEWERERDRLCSIRQNERGRVSPERLDGLNADILEANKRIAEWKSVPLIDLTTHRERR